MSEATQKRPSEPPKAGPKAEEDAGRMRTLVATEKLSKYYPIGRGLFSRGDRVLRAVDDVSIRVRRGETLGLVGESGCGKSTLGRMLLRLVDPTYGRIVYDGRDIAKLGPSELRPLRRKMQIIFQDPYSSLNPRMTVREIVAEAIRIHRLAATASDEEAMVADLLRKVGLRPEAMDRYPHEFSGGQRQRVGIARALAVQPEFIVCDEPISALDVSIQAQVMNLLVELQQRFGTAILFISHDLRAVRQVSHRVAVMYLGRIVEEGEPDEVLHAPAHPYAKALVSAIPHPGRKGNRILLQGDPPNPADRPTGCAFHPRCPIATALCARETPVLKQRGDGRLVACHLAHDAPLAKAA